MSYRSSRLLVEAVALGMTELRKKIMGIEASAFGGTVGTAEVFETLDELSSLFEEMKTMVERPSIDDVATLSPGDYVSTMKPLVRRYHQQLMVVDKLASALCEDLQANACVMILIGDGKTIVRTAYNENRPEVALAVEAILAAIDEGTKQVVAEGAAEVEKQLALPPLPPPEDEDPPVPT